MLNRTITVGSIGQVPILIHWSWAPALPALVVLLSYVYSDMAGGAPAWGLAAAAALLLYLSIALHELGHALAGRLRRLPVRGVTLFACGGRTEIDDERLGPLDELLIAAAGPAVSVLLCAGAALVWWYGDGAPLRALALTLLITNGGLLVLNLLPGYPLDGGRILKAALWFLTDTEIPAARTTMHIGRVSGWALFAIGIVYALGSGDVVNGLAIWATGYFLGNTAVQGFQHLTLRRALSGVQVADLMQRAYRAVGPGMRLDQFVGSYVLGQLDQGFPVLPQPDSEAPQPLLGMMTLRDLRRFTLPQWSLTHVSDAMTPASRVRALAPETPVDAALRALIESGEEQLPVVAGELLQGVLRRRDIVQFIHMQIARRGL